MALVMRWYLEYLKTREVWVVHRTPLNCSTHLARRKNNDLRKRKSDLKIDRLDGLL